MIRVTQREREALERAEGLDPDDGDERELLRLDTAELFASTTWLARAARGEIADIGGGWHEEPAADIGAAGKGASGDRVGAAMAHIAFSSA